MDNTRITVELAVTRYRELRFGRWKLSLSPPLLSSMHAELAVVNDQREPEPLIFDLLVYFALNRTSVITRQDLVRDVWKQRYVDDNAINRAMSELRKILKTPQDTTQYIKTHYKKGYSFLPDVERISLEQAAAPDSYHAEGNGNESPVFSLPPASALTALPAENNRSEPASADKREETGERTDVDSQPEQAAGNTASDELPGKPSPALSGKSGQKAEESRGALPALKIAGVTLFLLVIISLTFGWLQPDVEKTSAKTNNGAEQKDVVISRTNLLLRPGAAIYPVANQQSDLFAFVIEEPGKRTLYAKDLATMRELKVFSEESPDSYTLQPMGWGPDNTLIFKHRVDTGSGARCEVMMVSLTDFSAPGNLQRLVDCPLLLHEAQATLLRDADTLIYSKTGYRDSEKTSAIYARSLQTGSEYQISSPDTKGFGDLQPAVSPDETRLVFVRELGDSVEIWLTDQSGANQKRVISMNYYPLSVTWGSDSQSLLWLERENWRLHTYHVQSETMTTLVLNQDYRVHSYNIAVLDKRRLIYATAEGDMDIYALSPEAEDKKLRPLAASPLTERNYLPERGGQAGWYFLYDDGWELWLKQDDVHRKLASLNAQGLVNADISPDRSKILALVGGGINIYSAKSGELLNVLPSDTPLKMAEWLDDSQILLTRLMGRKTVIQIQDADSGSLTTLSDANGHWVRVINRQEAAVLDVSGQLSVINLQTKAQSVIVTLPNVSPAAWDINDDYVYYIKADLSIARKALIPDATEEVLNSADIPFSSLFVEGEGEATRLYLDSSGLRNNALYLFEIQDLSPASD